MPASLVAAPRRTGVPGPATGPPLTRFVGRDAEVAALVTAVRRTRLLSLVGPGGSGKTRLAHAVHDRLTDDPRRRTWWVSLAPLDRPALLVAAVADVLGVAEVPGRSRPDMVVAHLREHPGLLVLDNCEHLVAACAGLVANLLRACPDLRVLTTSREPLAITGETTWWVEGLSVPADLPAPSAADLADSQAVQLFADRARLARRDFTVTDDNAADVARLCRRLDGMPLVLELAAARLRVLPLPRIVALLDDAVSLLVTTNRDVPARQATLRATLDWSYDLLPDPERELFARLSVFRGGFTVDGAAAVAGADAPDTLNLLARLVDKSLVQARTDAAEERYRLLEVVRQYGAERLGDQRLAVAARHAAYMLDLAHQAERGLSGADQRLWRDRLHHDRGNLRAALTWARGDDGPLEVQLAGALGRYWQLTGQYAEGRQWLHAAVSGVDRDIAPAALAKALTALGRLEFLQCDYAAAAARLARARDLFAATGDERGVAEALQSLGSIARERGRYAEARAYHEEGLTLWRGLAEPVGEARALQLLGFTSWLEDDHARAAGLSGEALRRFRELGDTEGVVGALIDLAASIYRGGDPDGAVRLLRESLADAERMGLREATAWANEQLGLIAEARGDRAEAVARLRRSLTVHHELGDRWRTASVLEALAGVGADARTGARLLSAADRLRRELGTPLPPCDLADHERRVRTVRAELSQVDLERAALEGGALTVEQAVAAATSSPPVPAPASRLVPRAGLSVHALGRSRVSVDGRALGPEDWTYAKPRELMFYLLTRPGSTKAEIGLSLWPEASATELRNSFHTCLKFLRRALDGAARVRFADGAYHLEAIGTLRYDVSDFQAAVATAGRDGAGLEGLTRAAACYPGDFLTDTPVGAWAEPYREELRREYEYVLRSLGGLLAREQRFVEAADVFARLVAHDPLLEGAHRALMRCYAALGERGRALRQYEELVRVLETHVGARPAPETTELHSRLRGLPRAA
jgi:predicted ATPase/DNA-binding SARP family transcriptional activator